MSVSVAGAQALALSPVSICTVIIALRIYVRTRTRTFGLEDVLMTLSWAAGITTAGLAMAILQAPTPQRASRLFFIADITAILSLFFGKAAVGFLLIRFVTGTSPWRRGFMYGCLGVFVALTVVCLVVISYCASLGIEGFTEPQTGSSIEPVRRLDANTFMVWNSYGAFLDVVFSVMPMTILFSLQMSRKKQIGVSILMGLGWVAVVFTIIRTISTSGLHRDLEHFVRWKQLLWMATCLEVPLVIICGSMPTLPPLVIWTRRWVYKRLGRRDPGESLPSIHTNDESNRRRPEVGEHEISDERRGRSTNERSMKALPNPMHLGWRLSSRSSGQITPEPSGSSVV